MKSRNKGDKNPRWKGDDASYSAMQKRMKKELGTPTSCDQCGATDTNRSYEWTHLGTAGVLENYYPICKSCNRKRS